MGEVLEQPRPQDVCGHLGEDPTLFRVLRLSGGVVVVEATAITRAYACIGGVPGFGEVVPAGG